MGKKNINRTMEQNQQRQSTIENLKNAFQSAEQALPGVSGMFVDEILSHLKGQHRSNVTSSQTSQSSTS